MLLLIAIIEARYLDGQGGGLYLRFQSESGEEFDIPATIEQVSTVLQASGTSQPVRRAPARQPASPPPVEKPIQDAMSDEVEETDTIRLAAFTHFPGRQADEDIL